MDKSKLYAYMAGFVDADGSICIISVAKHKRYTAKIAVANCNYKVMEIFSKEFGGKIRKRVHKKEGREKWRDCYEWSLTQNKALAVIEKIYEYLIIKKKQADLVIKLQEIRKETREMGIHWRWHKEKWAERLNIMKGIKDECLKLNKRGKENETNSSDQKSS